MLARRSTLLLFGVELSHPFWDLRRSWFRDLSTRLRNVGRVDESLRLNVSELIVYRAAEVDGFLAESHAGSAIRKVPFENRKSDTGKPMHLPVGIDDEL